MLGDKRKAAQCNDREKTVVQRARGKSQPKAWGLVLSLKTTEAAKSVGRRLVQV